MEEMKRDETRRGHTLIRGLGVMILALSILVSITGAAPYAYITNQDDNTTSVIDTATNTVTAVVDIGFHPWGVAVSPDGGNVYVASYDNSIVSVINTTTNTITSTVDIGQVPREIAVSPDGTKVYVANFYNNTTSVIDTVTNNVTSMIPVGISPYGVALDPIGTKVYVTNLGSNNISVINTTTNTVTATVDVGQEPKGIAVSPDGTKVYVANNASNNVSVINTTTNTVTATVDVGQEPKGIAVSPDGTKVYVANFYNNTTSVIDTATNNVTATVPVGESPFGIAVSRDGTKVYVANHGSINVSVIDAATNTVTATVPVGNLPVGMGQFIGGLLENTLIETTSGEQETIVVPESTSQLDSSELSGDGTEATSTFRLEKGLSKFTMTYDGSSNFIVWLIDANTGQKLDLLANEIGSFDGSKAFGITSAGDYILNIDADGPWKVTVEQPRQTATQSVPLTLQGSGKKVTEAFYLDTGMKRVEMSNDGSSNFIVWLMDDQGNKIELLANEIGSFDGSTTVSITTPGTYLLDVDSDGNWKASIE